MYVRVVVGASARMVWQFCSL